MGKIFTLEGPRYFPSRKCTFCRYMYEPTSNTQKTCTKSECKKLLAKRNAKNAKNKKHGWYDKYFDIGQDKRRGTKIKRAATYLRRNRLQVEDERTIDYDESPTGRAYTGVAKSPLRKLENGHGFYGVMMQTENRELLQCHVCGKWLHHLTHTHLNKHGINKAEYNNEYGLARKNTLVSDGRSLEQEMIGRENIKKIWEKGHKAMLEKGRKRKARKEWVKEWHSEEKRNERGVCNKQMGARLVTFVKRFKDLPSRSTVKFDGRAIAHILDRRWGSLNKGFNAYGFPSRYRQGSRTEFSIPDTKELMTFNYNKFGDRNKVYPWLQENCRLLRLQDPELEDNLDKLAIRLDRKELEEKGNKANVHHK